MAQGERFVAELGNPGIDEEVLRYAVTLGREALSALLRPFLEHPRLPFSALALGLRVLLVVGPHAVEPELVVSFLGRALRLMSWLPQARLPGLASYETLAWQVLARHSRELGVHGPRLVAACHHEVGAWLRGERLSPGEEAGAKLEPAARAAAERALAERRKLAERLAVALELDVPVKSLLRFDGGVRLLIQRRGRGPWAVEELAPLLDDEDVRLVEAARTAWSACAPVEVVLSRLDFLSEWPPALVEGVLEVLHAHGSAEQKKEGLFRAALRREEFAYHDEDDIPLESAETLAGRLTDAGPAWWLGLWEWACRIGVLERTGAEVSEALERLCADLLHEPCARARWRALVARRRLFERGLGMKEWLGEGLALLAEEESRPVRIEAIELLRTAGARVPVDLLLPSLVSLDDAERWVGWRAAVESGCTPGLEQLVTVLASRAEAREEPPVPFELDWQEEPRGHGVDAYVHLVELAEKLVVTDADVEILRRLEAEEDALGEVASSILRRHPPESESSALAVSCSKGGRAPLVTEQCPEDREQPGVMPVQEVGAWERGRWESEVTAKERLEECALLAEHALDGSEVEIRSALLATIACGASPERLLELVQKPPEALRTHPVTSWVLPLARGIVQRGNSEQALKLARLRRDDAQVWEIANEEGWLAEHVLLLIGYLRHDPGGHATPADAPGGGGRCVESKVPKAARAVITRMAKRVGAEPVRRALVEGLLWEEGPKVELVFEEALMHLGGPLPDCTPRVLEHLAHRPDSAIGLALLATAGADEADLAALWRMLGVRWW